jgi:hypothetical protein
MDTTITIQDLYDEKAEMEVEIAGMDVSFSVDMIFERSKIRKIIHGTELEPDCKVWSFAENRWFRTKRGAEGTKYSSITDLKKGIQMSARARGLKVTGFILKLKK